MEKANSQSCGCKGIRKCLLCEQLRGAAATVAVKPHHTLYQCHRCGKILEEEEKCPDTSAHPLYTCPHQPCPTLELLQVNIHRLVDCRSAGEPTSQFQEDLLQAESRLQGYEGEPQGFTGVTVMKGFMSEEEEAGIVDAIDRCVWAESQSGRRKQDYGPKVNFKRQKVKLGTFSGLPPFSRPLVARMVKTVPCLCNFSPVELCNLDYRPERGSAIDPHQDDSWLWGERLVTLNLLSHTTLTFSTPPPSPTAPPSVTTEIHVPLPRRSLVVVEGPARYRWLHCIKRQHIVSRRLAVTLRELSPEFLPRGREEDVGRSLGDVAAKFDGKPTNFAM